MPRTKGRDLLQSLPTGLYYTISDFRTRHPPRKRCRCISVCHVSDILERQLTVVLQFDEWFIVAIRIHTVLHHDPRIQNLRKHFGKNASSDWRPDKHQAIRGDYVASEKELWELPLMSSLRSSNKRPGRSRSIKPILFWFFQRVTRPRHVE